MLFIQIDVLCEGRNSKRGLTQFLRKEVEQKRWGVSLYYCAA